MKRIGAFRIAVKFELANKFSIPVTVESLNLPCKSESLWSSHMLPSLPIPCRASEGKRIAMSLIAISHRTYKQLTIYLKM